MKHVIRLVGPCPVCGKRWHLEGFHEREKFYEAVYSHKTRRRER
jgi:hypothetical protein